MQREVTRGRPDVFHDTDCHDGIEAVIQKRQSRDGATHKVLRIVAPFAPTRRERGEIEAVRVVAIAEHFGHTYPHAASGVEDPSGSQALEPGPEIRSVESAIGRLLRFRVVLEGRVDGEPNICVRLIGDGGEHKVAG